MAVEVLTDSGPSLHRAGREGGGEVLIPPEDPRPFPPHPSMTHQLSTCVRPRPPGHPAPRLPLMSEKQKLPTFCYLQKHPPSFFFFFFLRFYLFIFRERGREGEKEGEKHQCVRETLIDCLSPALQPGTRPATQACALTGNRTGDLLFCRMILNQLSHASQGSSTPRLFKNKIVVHPVREKMGFSIGLPGDSRGKKEQKEQRRPDSS